MSEAKDKAEYEKTLNNIGWDSDCIFSALNGFDHGYEHGLRDAINALKNMSFQDRKFIAAEEYLKTHFNVKE